MNIIVFDLVGPEYPGGCEKYLSNLSNYLSKENQVTFLSMDSYYHFMNLLYRFLGRKILPINFVSRNLGLSKKCNISLKDIIFNYKKIRNKLLNSNVIYSKNEFQELGFLYLFLGKKEYEKRVIVGVHSAIFIPKNVKGIWRFIHDIQYGSILYGKFIKNSKLIHALNKEDGNLISKKYGVKVEKIYYIPNPIDWKTKLFFNKNKKFRLLWSGRLTQQKGLKRLELIVDLLSRENIFENLEIIIAGQAGEEEVIAKSLSVKYKNVKYVGFIKNIMELYKDIDLVLVTSYFETFGYNVLEPLSFGIPVISFDIHGPDDIIKNRNIGLLVNNEENFVIGIKSSYNKWKNESEYNLFKKNIYKIINTAFSKNKIYQKLKSLVNKSIL